MKLVLKVSGNEVTTGSSSRDTFYDEQPADHDKPKEKKKKKKKDKEKTTGSPDDDRGKKKVMPLSLLTLDGMSKSRTDVTFGACFTIRLQRRRKDRTQMGTMNKISAALLSDQSWISKKVYSFPPVHIPC